MHTYIHTYIHACIQDYVLSHAGYAGVVVTPFSHLVLANDRNASRNQIEMVELRGLDSVLCGMYVYVCMCMNVCIQYMFLRIEMLGMRQGIKYICIHIVKRTYIHTHIHAYIHTYIATMLHTINAWSRRGWKPFVHVCPHMHTYIYIHIVTHTHTYIHTYT